MLAPLVLMSSAARLLCSCVFVAALVSFPRVARAHDASPTSSASASSSIVNDVSSFEGLLATGSVATAAHADGRRGLLDGLSHADKHLNAVFDALVDKAPGVNGEVPSSADSTSAGGRRLAGSDDNDETVAADAAAAAVDGQTGENSLLDILLRNRGRDATPGPAATLFNNILSDVRDRRAAAQAATQQPVASGGTPSTPSAVASTPGSTPSTAPTPAGGDATSAVLDAVRDAVAEAARETLLSGTQEERDTLLESLTALDALFGSNVTVIDQLGAAENDGGANASAAVVAAALAQLEVAA